MLQAYCAGYLKKVVVDFSEDRGECTTRNNDIRDHLRLKVEKT